MRERETETETERQRQRQREFAGPSQRELNAKGSRSAKESW